MKKHEVFFMTDKFNEVKCRTFPLLACSLKTSYKCCIIYFNVFNSVRHICTTLKASDKLENVRHNKFDDQTYCVLLYRLIFRPHKKRPSNWTAFSSFMDVSIYIKAVIYLGDGCKFLLRTRAFAIHVECDCSCFMTNHCCNRDGGNISPMQLGNHCCS